MSRQSPSLLQEKILMKTKVAILQHEIGKGGRLSVIARIIKNLNEADIIPDIITGNIDLKLETIPKWYGYSIQANIINLKFTNKHLAEY